MERTKSKQARQKQHQEQQEIKEEGNKKMKYIASKDSLRYVKYRIIVSFATSSFWFFEYCDRSIELLGMMCKGCTKNCLKVKMIILFVNNGS